MAEWISVKDRLPDKNGNYLVSVTSDFAGVHVANFQSGEAFLWYPFIKSDVTHWMPLPEPPKEVE